MQGVPDEVAGEGETFEEAAQDAVRRRHQILGDPGSEPGKPDWVKVIRVEVLAHNHNQWATAYKVVIPGK
jgi:hypothetical protein